MRAPRPVEAPIAGKIERNFRARHAQLGRAVFAPHQRSERELDMELACAARTAAPRRRSRPAERQRRDREDADIDRAGDADRLAGEPGRLGLEGRAILRPIDKMRPDQRRYQRQDDRNAQSEQGRLQIALRAPQVLDTRDRLPSTPQCAGV
jgi:hypothetical protein